MGPLERDVPGFQAGQLRGSPDDPDALLGDAKRMIERSLAPHAGHPPSADPGCDSPDLDGKPWAWLRVTRKVATIGVRMTVPSYDQFIEPILRFLAKHPDGVLAREAHEAAGDALNLSSDDRQELLPSGRQAVYKNRAGWAHDRLKRVGYSTSPRRGFWKLTPEGRAFVSSAPTPLSEEVIQELATTNTDVRLRPAMDSAPHRDVAAPHAARESPDDRLETALAELHSAVVGEILEALAQVSPKYFETIVLDLLHRMGYGASRSDVQRLGGSGDSGIDGVISLDRLGLEKVYVQAKRWQQNTVGRPEVQAFYGALAGQRATKGVFITTSSFTAQAAEFANSVERVVLVDGTRLAALMIEHEVGVTLRPLHVPKLDSDYFEE